MTFLDALSVFGLVQRCDRVAVRIMGELENSEVDANGVFELDGFDGGFLWVFWVVVNDNRRISLP
jgi:hypothetical protein